MKVPQLQFSHKVVDVTVVQVVVLPQVQLRLWTSLWSCSDVGVSPTVEVPQIQFIAGVSGHSCCITETGTQLPAVAGVAAVKGFLAFFSAFFALFQVVWS